MKKQETVEDVIMRYSRRGMHVLRQYMEDCYCRKAAEKVLSLDRGKILLTTGFYVEGHAETDGPLGTMALSKALKTFGFLPVIITDKYCRGFFETEGLKVEYIEVNAPGESYEKLIEKHRPVCLISIERCGRNARNDYANMQGVSIRQQTAKIDLLFEKAREKGIFTLGVGDGGNEIGMGNLRQIIAKKLSLEPCTVEVDMLVIATVSNWGAYAMAAYMQKLEHVEVLPSYAEIEGYLKRIVSMGSVDGVTKKQSLSVDGFPIEIEKEILTDLRRVAAADG